MSLILKRHLHVLLTISILGQSVMLEGNIPFILSHKKLNMADDTNSTDPIDQPVHYIIPSVHFALQPLLRPENTESI